MIKVLGLSLYGAQAASTRYRLMQYAPGLRALGIGIHVEPLLGDAYVLKRFAGERYPLRCLSRDYCRRFINLIGRLNDYDVAIVYFELFPFMPGLIESLFLRIPYIYDFDDASFLKYQTGRFARLAFILKNKFDPIISRAAAVTAGNQYLAEYARTRNPKTHWLPTVVDINRFIYVPNKRQDAFTVGWIGSPSTSVYLRELTGALTQLGREGPVRLVVVGGHCPAIEQVEVVRLAWSEDTEVEIINTFDVGVMPLFDDNWAKGKCALKLVQYMACGVPAVASPIGANVDVISEGYGLLAVGSDGWLHCLRRLRDDLALRQSLGRAGRKRVERLYSLETTLPQMAKLIVEVAAST